MAIASHSIKQHLPSQNIYISVHLPYAYTNLMDTPFRVLVVLLLLLLVIAKLIWILATIDLFLGLAQYEAFNR